ASAARSMCSSTPAARFTSPAASRRASCRFWRAKRGPTTAIETIELRSAPQDNRFCCGHCAAVRRPGVFVYRKGVALSRRPGLKFGDQRVELPVVEGSEAELALDISQLRARTGLITLDPGFGNTGACESTITSIDGEKGILRYRGIPIEQLAERSNFTETAW